MYIGKIGTLGAFFSAAVLSVTLAQAAPKSGAKHLHQLNCAAGEIARFDGANWVCSSDNFALVPVCPPGASERFVDNGDGTICDHQTGLMWEKKDAADGNSSSLNPHDADNRYEWTNTRDNDSVDPDGDLFYRFLAQLNGDATSDPNLGGVGFAGYTDWRVPASGELQTILCEPPGSISPCIVDDSFDPTVTANYWSSTYVDKEPSEAFAVDFGNGDVSVAGKSAVFYVRAVRGPISSYHGYGGWGGPYGGGYGPYGGGGGYGPYGGGGGYGPYGGGGYPSP